MELRNVVFPLLLAPPARPRPPPAPPAGGPPPHPPPAPHHPAPRRGGGGGGQPATRTRGTRPPPRSRLPPAGAASPLALARLVDSSNQVFQAFAREDADLRSTLRQLPPTLRVTRTGLAKAGRFARALGPAASGLRPFARDLAPALRSQRPFAKIATPIVRDSVRPFTRASLPVVKELRPAARDLARVTPDLTVSLGVLNELFNEIAYDPPGPAKPYLFYTAWTHHAGALLFNTQDAHGPIRR